MSGNGRPKVLTPEDEELVWQLLQEGRRLRKEASYLTNSAVAAKFEVSVEVIRRILKDHMGSNDES